MKYLIYILLIFTLPVFGQTTYYVDEEDTGSLDLGTIDEPYTDFSAHYNGSTTLNNTTIYVARGNYITDVYVWWNNCNDLTVTAYGTGDKPVFYNDGSVEGSIFQLTSGSNYVFTDLSLRGDKDFNLGTACFYSAGNSGVTNITIRNCDFSYSFNGIRLLPNTSAQYNQGDIIIDSVHVHHCTDDGIMLGSTNDVNIANYYLNKVWVHDINYNWYSNPDSNGGDCIHITGRGWSYAEMDSSKIDRASTGCKFGLMWRGADNEGQGDSIRITNTYFRPPADTLGHDCSALGNGAFLFTYVYDVTMINCWIDGRKHEYCGTGWTGAPSGQFASDHMPEVQYTVFDSVRTIEGNANFTNCVVTGDNGGTSSIFTSLYVNGATFYNNIFTAANGTVFVNGGSVAIGSNNLQSDNLATTSWDTFGSWVDGAIGADYHRTSDLNDGIDRGLLIDLDGEDVSNPPEIGVYEYEQASEPAPPTSGKGNMMNGKLLISNGKILR